MVKVSLPAGQGAPKAGTDCAASSHQSDAPHCTNNQCTNNHGNGEAQPPVTPRAPWPMGRCASRGSTPWPPQVRAGKESVWGPREHKDSAPGMWCLGEGHHTRGPGRFASAFPAFAKECSPSLPLPSPFPSLPLPYPLGNRDTRGPLPGPVPCALREGWPLPGPAAWGSA